MASIQTIQATDVIANSRTDINQNFANLNSDKIETSAIDTDNTLAANSDAKLPSQKAVKAYVDAGGNVNASETTKGIVEEANDSEVTAGTATGATGAKLFITPAKLQTIKSTNVTTDGASDDKWVTPKAVKIYVDNQTGVYSVGDILANQNDAEKDMFANTSYLLAKETIIGKGGTLRISFEIKSSLNPYYGKAQIYRNGSAVGTERTKVDTSYGTYTEDISGWTAGDAVQIYAKNEGSGIHTYIKNFRIYILKGDFMYNTTV